MGRNEAAACRGRAGQAGDDAGLGLLRTTVTGRVLDCVHPSNRVVAGFGVGQDRYARGDRRGRRARATRDRALGPRDGIGGTRGGLCEEVGARQGCTARVQGTAVHIIGAKLRERRRPQGQRLRRLCPIRTSPIAIGRCRRRQSTHPGDDEGEQGQFDPLATVGAIVARPIRDALIRAGCGSYRHQAYCKDERS